MENPSQDHTPTNDSTSSDQFLLGFVIVNIVGLQHYSGRTRGREMVGLIRDPLNGFDSNAIKVLDIRSSQVGFIERSSAAILSPLVDRNLIKIEGIVPKTLVAVSRYQIPCQIHIFAKVEDFPIVKSEISVSGLSLISGSNPAFSSSEAAIVKERKSKKEGPSVDDIFKSVESSEKDITLKPLEPPKDIILTELFMHQKQGLGWLVNRETTTELPPFWIEKKEGQYLNMLTDYSTDKRPNSLNGGIFADDMGLGKTLTLLSLIATNRPENTRPDIVETLEEEGKEEEGLPGVERKRSRKRKQVEKPAGSQRKHKRTNTNLEVESSSSLGPRTTLIVCPSSVISTWVTQLDEHTKPGPLKVCMYYGTRTDDPEELQRYDIVLTTYGTLASERSRSNSPIKKIEWFRVILDEAHAIKNPKSAQAEAVGALNSKRRWLVTGTPILNGSFDLYSFMAFLRFEPFSVKSHWDFLVQQPLDRRNKSGFSRLQALMAKISLRRLKDEGLVKLPPKTVETYFVDLTTEEREKYDLMEKNAQSLVRDYIHHCSIIRNYSTVLSIILRLRQICNDGSLCPSEPLPSYDIEDVSKNPDLLRKMVTLLQDGEDFDCPICISPPIDTIITRCAHIFCKTCILRALDQQASRCPMCRRPVSKSDIFSAPPEEPAKDDESNVGNQASCSSKVSVLLDLLKKSKEENPSIKSVVFSQFRKMLLLLEEPLKAAGFKVLRLDGGMSAVRRGNVISEFKNGNSNSPFVLLATLKASGAGINLTAASRVYLFDPWWNPAVEEQAMDRVHRIGQKKDVKVVRLIVKNSIEERVLELQERKKNLARHTCGKNKEGKQMGSEDLRILMAL